MAIIPETKYTGKIKPSSAEYPYGEARNITVPGDGTGTPWEAALVNDIFGFQQSLLEEAEITPSGNPDKVGASQYLEAVKRIGVTPVDTIAALRLREDTPLRVYVTGYHTAGDGAFGSNIFKLRTGVIPDGSYDNGGTVIETVNGVYDLQYSGAVHVKWFGIMPDNTDYSSEMQEMYDSLSAGQTMQFGEGVYLGYLQCLTSGTAVRGMGSNLTTIKIPDGAIKNTVAEDGVTPISGVPTVIDLGELNRGNNAVEVSGINVSGLTLDGNKSNTTAPTLDLFGWGLTQTKHSNFNITDIRVINCHNGGVGTFINSNYGNMEVYAANCDGVQGGQPQVDFNSSKYINISCVTDGGNYGGRILDNCFGINYKGVHKSPVIGGFSTGNQTVNFSHGNIIDISVLGGCSANALSIGANVTATNIKLVAKDIEGFVYQSVDQGVNQSHGNTIEINSSNSKNASVINSFDNATKFKLLSSFDSESTAQFANYAVVINGSDNTLDVLVEDTDVGGGQIRDIQFNATADNNTVNSFYSTHANPLLQDLGTNNRIVPLNGVGADIASANEIRIDWKNNIFSITGTTTIVNIVDPIAAKNKTILLKFPDVVTLLETGNINLTSSFTSTAGSWIMLLSDGVGWYEVSRKVV